MELDKSQYKWAELEIIGTTLLIDNRKYDINGELVIAGELYEVGAHNYNGDLAIIPTKKLHKTVLADEYLKKRHQLN